MEDDKLWRDSLFTFFEEVLSALMPIAVFGSFAALGNTLTLSKVALTTIMLNKLCDRLEMTRGLHETYFSSMACMERLWEFYTAPDA